MNKENIFTRLHQQLPRRLQPTLQPHPSPRRKPRSRSAVVHDAPPPSPMMHTPHATLEGDPNDPHTLLRGVFLFYCRFGRTGTSETTMDGTNFAKFCRECPSLIGARFANVDIDITFAKVKPKGERRISYALFLEALGTVALKRYPDLSLESALPRLLKVNIAMLPCVVDTQTGSPVKAVWRRRQLPPEHSDSTSDAGDPEVERQGDPEMEANNDPYELATLPPPIPQRRRTFSSAPDL
ncbi:hypothetical protein SPRG_01009 [Saprolegnia parasitica CBS 223.65]|uniref:Uncharacterized protein n=1 Tax=Saprolegnia parasitica (strain CBS 223.65) TaxID=695850 RepID=A0A067D7F9_SAPPC|nr:hypothetical protein SPRG_01009 [Saprolegnia parasitica CBS 223.65]KDO34947.1 hypothetical protein SPRG_01009 [Saprolegnia parasitica CBS 223.65]|eukprot:XP_012194601.1 hypothetical protein SPRG_01009 [Saprolegnia parasitica CBS 223.65]